MRGTILLLLLLASDMAHADFCDALLLQLSGWSQHYGYKAQGLNSDNAGVGLVCDASPNLSLLVGTYRNSFDRTSTYTGAELLARFGGDWHIDPGVMAGLATGYGSLVYHGTHYTPLPVVGYAALSIGYRRSFRLTVGYAPARALGGVRDVATAFLEVPLTGD